MIRTFTFFAYLPTSPHVIFACQKNQNHSLLTPPNVCQKAVHVLSLIQYCFQGKYTVSTWASILFTVIKTLSKHINKYILYIYHLGHLELYNIFGFFV